MKQLKFLAFSIIGIFGFIYVLYVGYIYFNQAEMVFIASKLDQIYSFQFDEKFEEINVKSFDGKSQHGILFKTEKPKGLIFYLHGNAGNLQTWGEISKIYTNLGYDIFILDYRGFGKSEDKIENEIQVVKDVEIVFDKVAKKYDKKIIIGYSIGTGIAAHLASVKKNDMLILKAPYDNFLNFTSTKVPFYPDFLKNFRFETDKCLPKIKTPIYLFHGNKDQLIPLDNSKRLKNILKPTDKLFILNNQGHHGINDNLDYQDKLNILLK
ncbi:MAG: alpha/beta fold hydrolase [Limnohabitans sp.]|nr:alpha/beta fold hydrolase [Limnohabitans sp.]